MAFVFIATALSALGGAVYASLCGALSWVLGGKWAPIFGVLWFTACGAVAGFLVGMAWALDPSLNRGKPSMTSEQDRRRPAT
jgi:hypothetical protein